jgi:hypothetical protein
MMIVMTDGEINNGQVLKYFGILLVSKITARIQLD